MRKRAIELTPGLSLSNSASAVFAPSRSPSNPRPWVTHFGLAAALGLKGDLNAANAVLAELVRIKPEVNSLARFRVYRPWGNPQYWTLYEKTAAAGLRRAGFPDE